MASRLDVAAFGLSAFMLAAGAAPAHAQIDDSSWIRPEGHVAGAIGGSPGSDMVIGAAAAAA